MGLDRFEEAEVQLGVSAVEPRPLGMIQFTEDRVA